MHFTTPSGATRPHGADRAPRPNRFKGLRHALVAVAVLAALAGCGGGGAAASTTTPAPSPAPTTPPAGDPAATPPATPPATVGSAGCGSAARLSTGLQSLVSDGTPRSYWIEMPAGYDRTRPYPVIIALHWRDGSAGDVYGWNGFFGLKSLYGNGAIFIAPQGLDAGWANSGDRDIRFLRSVITQVQQGTCSDLQRVFATGFSFGGMMSVAIGCQMGDVVRAIAPLSSSLWSGCGTSQHRVAALFDHAMDDNGVPYWAGEQARNTFLARNNCSATSVPVGRNGCVEYQGCSDDKPVVWCGHPTGGHWPPAFSASETKAFFDRFQSPAAR